MRVTLRPATAADFVALLGKLPAHRTRGIAAWLDDELLGIGGLVMTPNGDVWASAEITPRGRQFPVAVHRAGRAVMQLARSAGFSRVYATADQTIPGTTQWLEALGFRRNGEVFLWQPDRS